MTGRQSFIIRGLILSGPDDLLRGNDKTTRRTSWQVTALNLNWSISVITTDSIDSRRLILLVSAR
jgi:hypothetical protein